MKKTRKSAQRAARNVPAEHPRLEELSAALHTIDPGADYPALGRQITKAVVEQPGIAGVRLWRMADGHPDLWREDGTPGPAQESTVEKLFASSSAGRAAGGGKNGLWIGPLGNNGNVLGVLEVHGRKSLSADTRGAL